MRILYTFLLVLALPFWLLRFWTGRAHAYRARWRERLGFFGAPPLQQSLWLHAASMGEVAAAAPLICALQQRYPQHSLVITTITPTGSQRVRALFGEAVFHVYLPYDLPCVVRRFLDRCQPALAIVVETEIWPNLYRACCQRGLPILIANARLSERSLSGYRRLTGLLRPAIRAVSWVSAQSIVDAERYRQLGVPAERVEVSGNLKFDASPPEQAQIRGEVWRKAWAGRPVWIAASIHEGEQAAIWQAHRRVLTQLPTALLLLAPRHPERFRAVEAAVRAEGFTLAYRSQAQLPEARTQIFLLDSIGELLDFYAASDLVFVGGSLCPVGGHNLLEPAALMRPILTGPYTFHNKAVARSLRESGGLEVVASGEALGAAVVELLQDPARRQALGKAASHVLIHGRGALARTMQRVETLLQAAPES